MPHISDMTTVEHGADLRGQILQRIAEDSSAVWTPSDFADLAGRAAVDKALQRLALRGDLRRIDRGLYDRPGSNKLTGKHTVPNYRAVIQAVARRDNVRFVVDGMTAANDLGLTTAVPAKIEVLVDSRLKSIKLGNQGNPFQKRSREQAGLGWPTGHARRSGALLRNPLCPATRSQAT
jgi:hypothetical protein